MNKSLAIPPNKRQIFTEPLGYLISGTRKDTIPRVVKFLKGISSEFNIFIVGDIVTQDFLSDDFLKTLVKICIIDGKTKREKIIINFEGIFDKIIEFKNPVGIIHKDSWSIIRQSINSEKKTLIKIIEGEEDLLVIPLVMEILVKKKVKNFIIYGQPPITDSKIKIDEGIVLVEVTKKIKKKISNIIKTMNILS
ncbi:MAG: DUF359 domain-containing protein [Candidatus Lokiarchaeota archaeon]|nr:DUF359 domain-containing protein [Candidatus Lokiarchaeota archaeon]